MKKIELDHWFIKDSKLSISLMNLYVEIKIFVVSTLLIDVHNVEEFLEIMMLVDKVIK